MRPELVSLAGVIIAAAVSYLTARLSRRAEDAKTQVDREVGSGQLALQIAQRADHRVDEAEARVAKLERWRGAVMRWWPLHERWDDSMEAAVRRATPGAVIPPRPDPPIWDDAA